jgi:hypothetical protein
MHARVMLLHAPCVFDAGVKSKDLSKMSSRFRCHSSSQQFKLNSTSMYGGIQPSVLCCTLLSVLGFVLASVRSEPQGAHDGPYSGLVADCSTGYSRRAHIYGSRIICTAQFGKPHWCMCGLLVEASNESKLGRVGTVALTSRSHYAASPVRGRRESRAPRPSRPLRLYIILCVWSSSTENTPQIHPRHLHPGPTYSGIQSWSGWLLPTYRPRRHTHELGSPPKLCASNKHANTTPTLPRSKCATTGESPLSHLEPPQLLNGGIAGLPQSMHLSCCGRPGKGRTATRRPQPSWMAFLELILKCGAVDAP